MSELSLSLLQLPFLAPGGTRVRDNTPLTSGRAPLCSGSLLARLLHFGAGGGLSFLSWATQVKSTLGFEVLIDI